MKIKRNKFILIILTLLGITLLCYGSYRLGREHGAKDKSHLIKEIAERCAELGGFMWIEPGHLDESEIVTNCGKFKVTVREDNCFKIEEGGEYSQ